MDENNNPFFPGAGVRPPELAGRGDILKQASMTLARLKHSRYGKSLIIVGLRGTGKTVLLRQIVDLAKQEHYPAEMIEIDEQKTLPAVLLPVLRRILFDLDIGERVSEKVKRAFRVLKSFVSSIKLRAYDVELGLNIDPERGAADSGDLESDLAQVFIALGEAAKDRNTAVAIVIDELQYLSDEELSALIMAMHQMAQHALPVVLVGAGLPQLVGKAGRAKSYAERLFSYPQLGPLKVEDAKAALQVPVKKEGVSFTDEALKEIIRVTEGYPYFLQEWGYQAWNLASYPLIDVDIIKKATEASIPKLDQEFFRVRFDRLTPREKDYLRALAELGGDSRRSGEIAEQLGLNVQNVASLRSSLIKKGMIYAPSHGETAFTVPLFDGFMKRAMPDMLATKNKRTK